MSANKKIRALVAKWIEREKELRAASPLPGGNSGEALTLAKARRELQEAVIQSECLTDGEIALAVACIRMQLAWEKAQLRVGQTTDRERKLACINDIEALVAKLEGPK